MVLSDSTMRTLLSEATDEGRRIVIDPLVEGNIESASIDLRLGSSFKRPVPNGTIVDTASDTSQEFESFESEYVKLENGESILAETLEYIELPPNICAHVTGRSSVGRLFLSIHETAGFIDPGFQGSVTLELVNNNPNPVRIHHGDRICQIIFYSMQGEVCQPYGHERSQYQGQIGATEPGMKF